MILTRLSKIDRETLSLNGKQNIVISRLPVNNVSSIAPECVTTENEGEFRIRLKDCGVFIEVFILLGNN